ncbi:MAG: FHA domain-containing protein [Fusicatenibacter sp.]|nr:FHA domain-containing protein [Fusicatenibacter sp.]
MQIDYRRDMNHNYLIIHGEAEPDTASYQIRMLLTNTIPDLLNCRIGKVDNRTLFYYDITSKQSLDSLFEHRSIGHEVLEHLFEHLFALLEELGNYLLTEEGLLLAPELIYTDAGLEHFSFCYLPCEQEKNGSLQEKLRELMEYILPKLDHQDEGAVALGYGLYREISIGTFSLDLLKNLLYQTNQNRKKTQREYRQGEKAEIPAFQSDEEKEKIQKEKMHQQILDSFFSEEDEEDEEDWEKIRNLAGGAACVAVLGVIVLFRWFHVSVIWYFTAFLLVVLTGLCLVLTSLIRKNRTGTERVFGQLPKFGQILRQKPWESGTDVKEDFLSFAGKEEDDAQMLRKEEVKRESQDQKAGKEQKGQTEMGQNFDSEAEDLYEETELLGSGPTYVACLIPVSPADLPLVALKREIVLIGKLSSAADVVLPYNTISRLHAKITKTAEGYFLTDLNSRNGTRVNGEPLQGEEKRLLGESDEITFADKTYRFTMKGC